MDVPQKIILYQPHPIFDVFIDAGIAELFDTNKKYKKDDMVVCPIFWGLTSIECVRLGKYELAMENSDSQGYKNPLIAEDVLEMVKKYDAKILLFNDWEARDIDTFKWNLYRFTTLYLKMPLSKVFYSTTSYTLHMHCINTNMLSYDWVYIREKWDFEEERIVEYREDKKYPILSLNYRGNPERYAYCYYLYHKHRESCLFSYLGEPQELQSEHKQLLGSVYSKENSLQFNDDLPVEIDGPLPEQHQTRTLHSFFLESYVHVMFETNYLEKEGLAQQVSEKTYMNIRIAKPFLIFTTHGGILQHLRNLGFKTFSPMINEAYDDRELTYEKRYELLLRETDRICKMSGDELKNLDKKLKPIVMHNLNHLKSNLEIHNIFEQMMKPGKNLKWLTVSLKWRIFKWWLENVMTSLNSNKQRLRGQLKKVLFNK